VPLRSSTYAEQKNRQAESDRESCDLYNLANSILTECREDAQLSDLETAIYLFREALVQRPAPHPLRSDSLKDLSRALVVRFWRMGRCQDLDDAILGYSDARKTFRGGLQPDSKPDVCLHVQFTIS
jgi:hypothetical protein